MLGVIFETKFSFPTLTEVNKTKQKKKNFSTLLRPSSHVQSFLFFFVVCKMNTFCSCLFPNLTLTECNFKYSIDNKIYVSNGTHWNCVYGKTCSVSISIANEKLKLMEIEIATIDRLLNGKKEWTKNCVSITININKIDPAVYINGLLLQWVS